MRNPLGFRSESTRRHGGFRSPRARAQYTDTDTHTDKGLGPKAPSIVKVSYVGACDAWMGLRP